MDESLKAGDLRSAIKVFITFCTEHFSEFQKLLNSQRRAQIEELLIDAAKAYMVEVSRHNHPDLYVNYEDMQVLLQFNACGLVGVLLEYSKTPSYDQEKLVQQLEQILSGELLHLNPEARL